ERRRKARLGVTLPGVRQRVAEREGDLAATGLQQVEVFGRRLGRLDRHLRVRQRLGEDLAEGDAHRVIHPAGSTREDIDEVGGEGECREGNGGGDDDGGSNEVASHGISVDRTRPGCRSPRARVRDAVPRSTIMRAGFAPGVFAYAGPCAAAAGSSGVVESAVGDGMAGRATGDGGEDAAGIDADVDATGGAGGAAATGAGTTGSCTTGAVAPAGAVAGSAGTSNCASDG